MQISFPAVEIAFVVGICGVTPIHPENGEEIILGDCIVSTTLTKYGLGRQYPGRFIPKTTFQDVLGRKYQAIHALANKLQISRNIHNLSTKFAFHLEALERKNLDSEFGT